MSEIMGTLFKYLMALLGIAVVAGILYMAMHKNKGTTEAGNVLQLSTNVTSTYSGQSAFTGLTTAVCAKLAPQGMSPDGATLVNQWGGAVSCAVNANPAQFDVVENAVPSDGCVDLVTHLKSYVSVTLAGTTYDSSTPLDAGTATTQCHSAATQAITLSFGK
ncbi:MAG: type 4 pilus major pilin [Rhodanobacter sp.]|jgi:hypothetical protein